VKKVWVFASGSGSNAEKLFAHFSDHAPIQITGLLCNNPSAGVIEKARNANIGTFIISNAELNVEGHLLELLSNNLVDYIILAGFLRKIPDDVVHAYSDKIINVHPALLPKYGGKGMYGMHVHRAVKDANETQTGITIHLVNEHYDEGRVLFQASANIDASDTSEDIALKVQKLEHEHFANICEAFIMEH